MLRPTAASFAASQARQVACFLHIERLNLKLIAVDDDIYRLPCGVYVGRGLRLVPYHQIMVGLLSTVGQTAAILTWSES